MFGYNMHYMKMLSIICIILGYISQIHNLKKLKYIKVVAILTLFVCSLKHFIYNSNLMQDSMIILFPFLSGLICIAISDGINVRLSNNVFDKTKEERIFILSYTILLIGQFYIYFSLSFFTDPHRTMISDPVLYILIFLSFLIWLYMSNKATLDISNPLTLGFLLSIINTSIMYYVGYKITGVGHFNELSRLSIFIGATFVYVSDFTVGLSKFCGCMGNERLKELFNYVFHAFGIFLIVIGVTSIHR